jgi:two-component system NarL family sensor kinase
VTQLVNEFEQRSGLHIHYGQHLGDLTLVDGAPVALFRILQEALTNIERHAHASNVYIELSSNAAHVRLAVIDDGVGFEVDGKGMQGGIGLRNIRERVEHFSGQLHLFSMSGRSEIIVTLPTRVNS